MWGIELLFSELVKVIYQFPEGSLPAWYVQFQHGCRRSKLSVCFEVNQQPVLDPSTASFKIISSLGELGNAPL